MSRRGIREYDSISSSSSTSAGARTLVRELDEAGAPLVFVSRNEVWRKSLEGGITRDMVVGLLAVVNWKGVEASDGTVKLEGAANSILLKLLCE